MENCDYKTAMKKLSDYFNVHRENNKKASTELWDYEWKMLGVEPDMVSKNLDINLVAPGESPSSDADINLFLEQPEQLKAFKDRYHISLNVLRKSNPVDYHNLLKRRVLIPLFRERDDYYATLLNCYKLVCEIGDDTFAQCFASSQPNICEKAEAINKKSLLLRRAVDDISLLKTPLFNLNPKRDIEQILNGQIEFQQSQMSWYDLCREAKKHSKIIVKAEFSLEEYQKIYFADSTVLNSTPYFAHYQKGICQLYFLSSDVDKIKKIFSQAYLRRNFSSLHRRGGLRSVYYCYIYRLRKIFRASQSYQAHMPAPCRQDCKLLTDFANDLRLLSEYKIDTLPQLIDLYEILCQRKQNLLSKRLELRSTLGDCDTSTDMKLSQKKIFLINQVIKRVTEHINSCERIYARSEEIKTRSRQAAEAQQRVIAQLSNKEQYANKNERNDTYVS